MLNCYCNKERLRISILFVCLRMSGMKNKDSKYRHYNALVTGIHFVPVTTWKAIWTSDWLRSIEHLGIAPNEEISRSVRKSELQISAITFVKQLCLTKPQEELEYALRCASVLSTNVDECLFYECECLCGWGGRGKAGILTFDIIQVIRWEIWAFECNWDMTSCILVND